MTTFLSTTQFWVAAQKLVTTGSDNHGREAVLAYGRLGCDAMSACRW